MKLFSSFFSLAMALTATVAASETSDYVVIDNPIATNTTIRLNKGLIGTPCDVRIISNGEIRECPLEQGSNTFEFERDGQRSSGEFSRVHVFRQNYDAVKRVESTYKGEMTLSGKKIQVDVNIIETTTESSETPGQTHQKASVRIGDKLTYELK